MFFLRFQTLMPRILSIDKTMGKHPLQKVRDHVSFGGLSIDVSANILVDCRSIYRPLCWPILGQESVEYRLNIDRHLGRVVFCCRSHIGWQIDQQSVEIASVVCQQYIGELSVEYWWGISGVSVNNQHHLESVNISADWCFTVGQVSANKSTNSRPWFSISSMSPEYRWTVGRLLVSYQWCIGQQPLSLLLYALPFVTRFLTSADTQRTLLLLTHISFGW